MFCPIKHHSCQTDEGAYPAVSVGFIQRPVLCQGLRMCKNSEGRSYKGESHIIIIIITAKPEPVLLIVMGNFSPLKHFIKHFAHNYCAYHSTATWCIAKWEHHGSVYIACGSCVKLSTFNILYAQLFCVDMDLFSFWKARV